MIKQKLIANAITAAVAISGVTISIEKFQSHKIEQIKTNYQTVETKLKENEAKLVGKYEELYNTAKTNIQALEAENQKLKQQLEANKNNNTENNNAQNTETKPEAEPKPELEPEIEPEPQPEPEPENTEVENTEVENVE